MSEKIYKGEVGKVFRLDTKINITQASVMKFKLRKPDGSEGTDWTGINYGTTKMQYTTTSANDLDQAGDWQCQAYVEMNGKIYWGRTTQFTVHDQFES